MVAFSVDSKIVVTDVVVAAGVFTGVMYGNLIVVRLSHWKGILDP